MYTCPVCFYPEMPAPPRDWNICPCCGVEFGFDDVEMTHEELRAEWILEGYEWFSPTTLPPENWDPRAQINRDIST